MKIHVLNDDRTSCLDYKCEHGLSLLIEMDNKKILFDAGQSDLFIFNASKMNVKISDIDCIVLSHGDYDHGNGLKFLNIDKKIDLYAHEDIFKNRISKRTGKYDGLNQTRKEIENKYNLHLTKKYKEISDNIIFLGEIEHTLDFESRKLPMVDEKSNDYRHFDDTGIALKTPLGLIIVSGCSHSGICNTIEYAKKICKCNSIYAVIGGFHLKKVTEETLKTINYFRENDVKKILLAHCTSDEVCEEFVKAFPSRATVIKTGEIYNL